MPFDHTGYWYPPEAVYPAELHRGHPACYKYHDQIPPYKGQTPGQLLSEYYGESDQPDWTDPSGLFGVQMITALRYPNCVGAPIGSAGLIGCWPRPNGYETFPVPVGIPGGGQNMSLTTVEIEFRTRNEMSISRGVPLCLMYLGAPRVLKDADEVILDKFRTIDPCKPFKDVQLTIAWPGYEPSFHPIPLPEENQPFTRHYLARHIGEAYATFFQGVEREGRLPNEPNCLNIALHQGARARQDSLGVQFSRVYLVRFRNTAGGFWVADVEIG